MGSKTNAQFDELMAVVGRQGDPDVDVEIKGRDPILQTRFRLADTASAVLAGIGVAAADLWKLRTGEGQKVSVDARHAAASLRSYMYMKLTSRSSDEPMLGRAAMMGSTAIYETKDGRFFHTHGSFDPEGMLECIGASEASPEAVAASVKKWDALDLENHIAEAGRCGAMVRSPAEWAEHPHGQALAAKPVVEVFKIGDSDPEPFGAGDRPLSGMRVIDFTRVLAGPTCARTLAEHGADVLRVNAEHLDTSAAFDMDTGHGKRSVFLDLRAADDKAKMDQLVKGADVFSQGYRPHALERLGYSAEQLHELRPGIIYVSINCYGYEGPFADRPGWEQLGQSVSGVAYDEGYPDRPRLVPAAACDYTTGYLAAFGALTALGKRARDGGSYHVRVSLARSGMWFVGQPRVPDEVTLPGADALGFDDAKPFQTETATPYGNMIHLAPVVQMSATQPKWALPTVPLGSSKAEWLQ